ncbi:MAG TPA: imelysin family protein [Solirubrobacterales bacterium]
MTRIPVRTALITAGFSLVAILAAGCGSSEEAPADAKKMAFKLTDAGCVPHDAKAAAGPIEFEVENSGTSKVTEMEILDGETVLGEKENLTEGLSGSFALTLEQGEYVIYCPGGSNERGTLTISGTLKAKDSAEVEAAISKYRRYLEQNTDELVAKTTPFVAAVVAGNVAEAKSLYAAARIPYERIEPVAESFGNLDPRIDARANDVPADEFGVSTGSRKRSGLKTRQPGWRRSPSSYRPTSKNCSPKSRT